MNENNKLSIIIPIYNVEEYLRKCLDSVINQTYKNLEIICINDGSPDNSYKILEEYSNKDSRIVVITQKNKGVAAARNQGLLKATGDFITFVDPDDWIELDYYETALNALTKNEVDVFCCGIYDEYENRTVKRENKLPVKEIITDKNEFLTYIFKRESYKNFCGYIWNKVYKSNLFENVKFDETLYVGEDLLVSVELALKANTYFYTNSAYYHYLQRDSSAVHSVDLIKRETLLTAYTEILDLLYKYKINQETIIWIKRFRTYHASNLAEIAISQNNSVKLDKYKNEIKKYLPEYVETNSEFPDRIARIKSLLEYKL